MDPKTTAVIDPIKPFNRHAHKRLRKQQPHSGHKKPSPKPTPNPTVPANPQPSAPATIHQSPRAPELAAPKPNPAADHAEPVFTPTPATTFTDSLLFHLTNLANIEARQQAFPEKPLSQSHHRSVSRAFKFARHWCAAIALPQYADGITNHPPRELPRTDPQCERWFESLSVRIFHVCNNHMRAAHELLKNDPLRTSTMTDLNFDSLLHRVSDLKDFFTIAQQTSETQARNSLDDGRAGVEALGATDVSAYDAESETSTPTPSRVNNPSRVPACPEQGRREAAESEGAHVPAESDQASMLAPSDSAGTRRTKGMAAQPSPTFHQIEQAFLAARKNHPDPNAFSAEYIDNLIAIFEAGEAEELISKTTRQ